jgi:hypothetical protein
MLSEKGAGATFHLSLPLLQEESKSASQLKAKGRERVE